MASAKTITVTNETVTIPAMTDRPDASQFSDGVSKLVDGINSNTQAIANTQGGLAYIVGNTNTTGNTLAVGQFVYVKGHSTITEGLRTVTASISANGNITTSNTSACSEGGLNALNSKITNVLKELKVMTFGTRITNGEYKDFECPSGWQTFWIIGTYAGDQEMKSVVVSNTNVEDSIQIYGTNKIVVSKPAATTLRITATDQTEVTIIYIGKS